MSKLRTVWMAAMLAWPASMAAAQEAAPPSPEAHPPQAQPQPEPAPTEAAPAPPAAAQPAEAAAPAAPRYAPRAVPPPPIMVVVLTSGRVSDEVSAAVQQALVDQLTPMAGGRPVHALGAAELRSAIEACADDACLGGLLAQAGAQAGVIARLTGRGRRVQASIEIRDPVSGAPRREPIALELPPAAAEVPAALAAVTAQLEGAMPNPPPPPATLLVTTNIDGARVQLDGDEVGISPVAPVEVADGQHDLLVTARNYLQVRRQLRIQPGESARVDVTLSPIDGAVADTQAGGDWQAGGTSGGGGGGGDDLLGQWWFWTAIGGGAVVILAISIGIGVAVADSSTPAQLDPTGIPLPPISPVGGM